MAKLGLMLAIWVWEIWRIRNRYEWIETQRINYLLQGDKSNNENSIILLTDYREQK